MRAMSRPALAAVLLVMAAAGRASAQHAGRQERVVINLNAGVPITSTSFDVSTRHPVYLESSVIDTSFKYRNGFVFDGGVRYRIAGGVGIGVALAWSSQPKDVAISAAIPHPFYFQTPRTIGGTLADARHDTLAAHIEMSYAFRPARHVEVTIGAGPAFFRVTQTIVDDVSYRDVYPYDAPTFVSASTQQVSGHKAGFGASADVAVHLSRNVAVGGLVRASKAELQLSAPPATTIATAEAGGVHAAAGVRFYF
jgi:hypothetical protein